MRNLYLSIINNIHANATLHIVFILFFLFVFSSLLHIILRRYTAEILQKLLLNIRHKFARALVDNNVFINLSHIGAPLFFYLVMELAIDDRLIWTSSLIHLIKFIIGVYIFIYAVMFSSSVIDSIFEFFEDKQDKSKKKSLYQYDQFIKIVIIVLILIIEIKYM